MIQETFNDHTGKSADKWSSYLDVYEKVLQPYLDKPVNILEVGIANGGSLDFWAALFPEGKIVGVDIDPECGTLKYDNPRISVVIGDVTDPETNQKVQNICDNFDIIIDDGSHLVKDVIKTFADYFPLLGNNSLYIAEDLHTSYWTNFGGGLRIPMTSMGFFKQLCDIVNYEHWRLGIPRRYYLRYYESLIQQEFDEAELATIHSVLFHNSMVVIERCNSERNELGPRVIRGAEETVVENMSIIDGTDISLLDVTVNDDWQYEPIEMAKRINQLNQVLKDNAISIPT